jgi:predicted PolB exonuclease-like 3'-5' exonuclease
MINLPLNKLLFIDIETVGISSTYEKFQSDYPELNSVFIKNTDWFLKRFPEDDTAVNNKNLEDKKLKRIFESRSALIPEFAKIICVSAGVMDKEGKLKKMSYFNSDEKVLLEEVNKLLGRVNGTGFSICGHNVKNFDIPMLAKRMMINGIRPSSILPNYDTKPWEVRAVDTKDFWQYGQFGALSSLELMCISMGIPTPKNDEVSGDKIHNLFWNENKYDLIKEYCEKDVDTVFEVVKKIKSL